jgi:peroxiredoxin
VSDRLRALLPKALDVIAGELEGKNPLSAAVHVLKACGAYGMKTMYGKKVKGVLRSTFAFDEKGKVTHVWKSVKVDGHSENVLEALTKK